jgi:hypothetical protein
MNTFLKSCLGCLFLIFYTRLPSGPSAKQSKRAILVVWQTRKFKYVTKYKPVLQVLKRQLSMEVRFTLRATRDSLLPFLRTNIRRHKSLWNQGRRNHTCISNWLYSGMQPMKIALCTWQVDWPSQIYFSLIEDTVNIFDFTHYTVDTWRNQLIAEMLQIHTLLNTFQNPY